MKYYHVYFFILKIFVTLQIFLVIIKKHTIDSRIYIITDTILKISLAIYLLSFSFIHTFLPLGYEDIMILRLCGGAILFDIDYNGLANEFSVISKILRPIDKLNTV
jgi:hypothetical protein